jgi:hypothetical protein
MQPNFNFNIIHNTNFITLLFKHMHLKEVVAKQFYHM